MPEPDGSTAVETADPAAGGLDDALEAILSDGRPRDPEPLDAPDAIRPPASTTAEAPTGAPAEPEPAKAEVEAPESEGEDDEAKPPPRREAARLQATLTEVTQERDRYKAAAERAGVLPEQAREVAARWLGLVPDAEGQPAPYAALHEQATSRDGIQTDDDQARYNELVERQKVIPALWSAVEQMVRAEQAGHLVEPALGLDQDAVEKAGSLAGWKQAYRAAVEKATDEKVRAELQPKLDELQQQLATQKADYEGRLASARTTRAPISGGQSADRSEALIGNPRTPHDVMTNLAETLREEAGATV